MLLVPALIHSRSSFRGQCAWTELSSNQFGPGLDGRSILQAAANLEAARLIVFLETAHRRQVNASILTNRAAPQSYWISIAPAVL